MYHFDPQNIFSTFLLMDVNSSHHSPGLFPLQLGTMLKYKYLPTNVLFKLCTDFLALSLCNQGPAHLRLTLLLRTIMLLNHEELSSSVYRYFLSEHMDSNHGPSACKADATKPTELCSEIMPIHLSCRHSGLLRTFRMLNQHNLFTLLHSPIFRVNAKYLRIPIMHFRTWSTAASLILCIDNKHRNYFNLTCFT